MNQTTQYEIKYKPSMAARVARFAIPGLQAMLPTKVYAAVYDTMYGSYKSSLRAAYAVRLLVARCFGGERRRLKTSLTWRLLPYTMGGRKALENAFDVTALAEERNIAGALVECGVAEGGTAAMMALTNRVLGQDERPKWFFDSYEGLPDPTDKDYEDGKVGNFIRPLPKGACLGTVEQVGELMFDKLKFSADRLHLVKGWFQDSIPAWKQAVGPIAVLRLDGDWYESTKVPLDNFVAQLSPGALVIIDDYATCFGSRKAVDEFRAEQNLTGLLHPDGRGGVWFEMPFSSK